MTKHTIARTAFSTLGIAALLAPITAAALEVGVDTEVNAAAAGTAVSAKASADAKLLTSAKDKAYKEIDRRIKALTALNTRVQEMQRATDAFKANLKTNIETQISALTALRTKIEADTDMATLKSDKEAITKSYRVFALVMPQSAIAAASDRAIVTASMMTTLATKLQARVSSAESAGADVKVLNAALVNAATQLSNATSQAQAAVTVSAALVPDNGDKTVMENNLKALKTAREDIQNAQKYLQAARKDLQTVMTALGKLKPEAAASSTVQAR